MSGYNPLEVVRLWRCHSLVRIDPENDRFRTLLLLALKYFLANQTDLVGAPQRYRERPPCEPAGFIQARGTGVYRQGTETIQISASHRSLG